MRQKLAQSFIEIEIMRLTRCARSRALIKKVFRDRKGLFRKIFWTELNQRFQQVAAECWDPTFSSPRATVAIDDGGWAYSFLRNPRQQPIESGDVGRSSATLWGIFV